MAQDGGGLEQSVVRSQAPVGPDFEDEFVVIGSLTDAGVFDGVFHPGDRRENGIDRDETDGLVGALVFIARGKSAADAHFELGVELVFLVHRADELVGIEDFVALDQLDIAGRDFAFLIDRKRQLARLVLGRLELDALEVENDVGHVLDHARKSGEFVLGAGDFYRRDSSAFQ